MVRRTGKYGKLKALPIGSISEGTTKVTDVIRKLFDAAHTISMTQRDRSRIKAMEADYAGFDRADLTPDDYYGLEVLQDDVINILNGYIPPYTFIGNHRDDGANFGVWVDWEGINDGVLDKNELYRSENPPSPDYYDQWKPAYWLSVNDHGNTTLYRRKSNWRRWSEVWSVV